MKEDKHTGAGPYRFDAPELTAGESFLLDFREREKRRYKKYLPFDTAQVTNSSTSEPVNAEFNGLFETLVVPNAIETFDRQGITRCMVTNEGSNTIPAGEVTVEVKKEPYGADDKALEEKQQPAIFKAAKLGLGGIL